jgi:hypothetical protein
VAKTLENGTVRLRLHALDIATGQEKFGGSVLITATSTSNKGHVTNFNSLHQKNRPGLLLLNGVIYMGFGSNYCNDGNTGWVLAYDASSLQQVGSFNTSPDTGLTSIWQTGQGLAADEGGNIYAVTAESGNYDVPNGGQSFSHSVLKFSADALALTDYFTPWIVAFLNQHDLDLSSGGPVILPDQDGPNPHILVVAGKQGTIYVLNRDNLGMFSVNDSQIVQELQFAVGDMFSSPAYWNGMLYYGGNADVLKAFSVSSGLLSSTPVMTSSMKLPGAHSPSISANGNTNGILWVIGGGHLYAFEAVTLKQLYNSMQVKARDDLPPLAHFATQTVANGKVYVATRATLEVYGLLQSLTLVSGANQSAPVLTTLPAPIQVQIDDPYTGVGIPGVTVTFSDGGKGGTLNPPSAVSDSSGYVSTSYTFPQIAGSYTITASSASAGSLSIAETALPGPPTRMITVSGTRQSGQAGSILPKPLAVKIEDAFNNGVPGITATFVDQSRAGTLNPSTAVSNASGIAQVSYQLPNTAGTYKLTASALALTPAKFAEFATGSAPANLIAVSGNNQTAPVNSALPQPLVVQVTDRGGTPIAGVSVTFSAPSGTLTGTPATTDASGNATVNYTTGTAAGTVTITASVNALNAPITANVTAGAAATLIISGGNNQSGQAGSILPDQVAVEIVDAYNNGVPGITVTFVDQSQSGTLNPSTAVSNASGVAQVSYQVPNTAGTYQLAASALGLPTAAFTEFATGDAPANLVVVSGNNQTAPVNAALPQSLLVQVTDQGGNPIAGVSVIFSAPSGTLTGTPATTDSNGEAAVNYTTGTAAGAVTITASVNSLNAPITANVTAGAAATLTISGGNNQAGTAGTTLPQALTVVATDQYGNPVPSVAVNFDDGGAGGSFLNPNPATTDNAGTATQGYTLPPVPGIVNVTATAVGVANPAVFSETAQ